MWYFFTTNLSKIAKRQPQIKLQQVIEILIMYCSDRDFIKHVKNRQVVTPSFSIAVIKLFAHTPMAKRRKENEIKPLLFYN